MTAKETIAQENSFALFADGFEDAIIGLSYRFGREPVVAYDQAKCIEILQRDMTYEEAIEFFDFNTIGAWVGEDTPTFIERYESDPGD
jgi:hypothetical protein